LKQELESGREHGERTVVTDCSLAALRILKQTGTLAKHPIELLAEAYAPVRRSEAESP
jgi:Fe-S oxidoreductase